MTLPRTFPDVDRCASFCFGYILVLRSFLPLPDELLPDLELEFLSDQSLALSLSLFFNYVLPWVDGSFVKLYMHWPVCRENEDYVVIWRQIHIPTIEQVRTTAPPYLLVMCLQILEDHHWLRRSLGKGANCTLQRKRLSEL